VKNKIIFIVLLYALNIISSAKDVPADQFSKANLEDVSGASAHQTPNSAVNSLPKNPHRWANGRWVIAPEKKEALEKLLLSLNQACIESLSVKKPIQKFEFEEGPLNTIKTDYKEVFVKQALLGLKDLLDERFVYRFLLEMKIGEQVEEKSEQLEEKPKPQFTKKKPANKPLLTVINSHLRRHP